MFNNVVNFVKKIYVDFGKNFGNDYFFLSSLIFITCLRLNTFLSNKINFLYVLLFAYIFTFLIFKKIYIFKNYFQNNYFLNLMFFYYIIFKNYFYRFLLSGFRLTKEDHFLIFYLSANVTAVLMLFISKNIHYFFFNVFLFCFFLVLKIFGMVENYIISQNFKKGEKITFQKIQIGLNSKIVLKNKNLHKNLFFIYKRHFMFPPISKTVITHIIDKAKGLATGIGIGSAIYYSHESYHRYQDRLILKEQLELEDAKLKLEKAKFNLENKKFEMKKLANLNDVKFQVEKDYADLKDVQKSYWAFFNSVQNKEEVLLKKIKEVDQDINIIKNKNDEKIFSVFEDFF